jgi:hypothetical protein
VPSFPKRFPYAGLVAVAIFLFGTAIVVTRALFTAARAPSAAHKVAWTKAALSAPTPKASYASAPTPDGTIETVDSVAELARQLLVRPPDVGGFRTLITGETDGIDASEEALGLAKALTEAGSDVMLVDWAPDGQGSAETMGVHATVGMGDLLEGKAKFEDVVERVPGSNAHMIPAGSAMTSEGVDGDQLNLVLDALDTAYDHIVIVGKMPAARALFEAIQGRFDAGVIVADGKRRSAKMTEAPGTFLGFEVTDIELFRLERPVSSKVAKERLARVTAKGGAEARPT